jgi:hypothetical protein
MSTEQETSKYNQAIEGAASRLEAILRRSPRRVDLAGQAINRADPAETAQLLIKLRAFKITRLEE